MPRLDWLTRDRDIVAADRVPYRLLEEVPDLAGGDGDPGNMLVQGDNLEALKALLPFFAGQVKCIYIDPPYNTRSAFEHYDDNLEHAQWLAMIVPRLQLLREFLREDGSIWVSIDDNEGHYLKVVMDELFGRRNFIASNVWQKRYSRENREIIGDVHEYLHVYVRDVDLFKTVRNRIPLTKIPTVIPEEDGGQFQYCAGRPRDRGAVL
jgi:adenine-specific DNA-methyltransferase